MAVKPRYVFGEAWSIAKSGPRQTAMAVGLVALALYVPGLLALVSRNLARIVATEKEIPGLVLTLEPSADADGLANRAAADARVGRIVIVSSSAALERFRKTYPDLAAALTGLSEPPFPPTLEIFLRSTARPGSASALAVEARGWPGVESAETEETAARRFRDAVGILRGIGIFLGVVLALAAILSVSSAIRLALDLHRDEIEIMRLMGATETAVRAPFWLHASFEGLVGGGLALTLLYATFALVAQALRRHPHPVLSLLWAHFLDWRVALLLPVIGTFAGFLGSVISLGRNK
ncbi:MAG TPA: FtsX-like permease family protein [Thermoanaerobaculia bacterium]